MARKKKPLPFADASDGASPLTAESAQEQRFRARLTEALLFVTGELSGAVYPIWVRKAGTEFLRLLPPVILESAREEPKEFIEGLNCGWAVAGVQMISTMSAKEVKRFNQAVRTEFSRVLQKQSGFTPGIARALRQLDFGNLPAGIERDVGRKVRLEPLARQAFFDGFAIGLKPFNTFSALEKHLHRLGKDGDRANRGAVRRFLWLHWPEVEEAPTRQAVFGMCKSFFDSVGDRESVGTWEAFSRFCSREGVKRKDK